MNWTEIRMEVRDRTAVEAVANLLEEAGAGGVVIEDPQAIAEHVASGLWDAHEFDAALLARKDIVVKAYLPQDETLMPRVEQIIFALNEVEIRLDMEPTRVTYKSVQEEDWANAWKAYFKPERIGERTVVKPTWEPYTPQPDDLVIEIDPGMAFGTGGHATTALCIRLLERYVRPGMRVIDVGTGSGILAVQAARLGAAGVQALDCDTVAVAAAEENVALNRLEDRVRVRRSDFLSAAEGRADLIVANLVADSILRLTPQAGAYLEGERLFLASGIIDTRKDEIVEALSRAGFAVLEEQERDGWVAVVARFSGTAREDG